MGLRADGDDLIFGSAPPRPRSLFDLTRGFSSLTFNGDSPLFATNLSGESAQHAFSGLGFRAFDTPGTGNGRQSLFADADAGNTGNTILFTNKPGVNGGSGQFWSHDLSDGRVVEDGALWDAAGQLLAQSRQLALVRSDARQHQHQHQAT